MPVTTRPLRIEQIRIDGDTQARVAINDDVVAEYAEALQADVARANWPPVITYFDATDYWLSDGFHRVLAARAAGLPSLLAEINPGTREDARWAAIGANKTHGLRRSNADKRRAVELALAMHPEFSDRAIAEHCGVSERTVWTVRHEHTTPANCGSDTARVGVDGVRRPIPPPPPRRPPPSPPRPLPPPFPDSPNDTSPDARPEGPPTKRAVAAETFDAYGTVIRVGDLVRYGHRQEIAPKDAEVLGRITSIDFAGNLNLRVWNPTIGLTEQDARSVVGTPRDCVCLYSSDNGSPLPPLPGQTDGEHAVPGWTLTPGGRAIDPAETEILDKAPENVKHATMVYMDAHPKVSACQALAIVERRQVEVDAVGRPIPSEAREIWGRRQEAQDLLTAISQVRSIVRRAQDEKDLLFAEMNFSSAMAHLDQAYATIETAKPYAVCPSCQGLLGCRLCCGRRVISKYRWDTCVTREQKEAAKRAAATGE